MEVFFFFLLDKKRKSILVYVIIILQFQCKIRQICKLSSVILCFLFRHVTLVYTHPGQNYKTTSFSKKINKTRVICSRLVHMNDKNGNRNFQAHVL